MAIPPDGTFDYTFEVLDGTHRRWQGRLRKALTPGTRRLLGEAPFLETMEYQREPWQLYARITLRAAEQRTASLAQASFSVDRELARALRPGDFLHMSRSPCGGIGISIVRGDHLVAAAGAITLVPLGSDVSARCPADLIEEAEAVFQRRAPKYHLRDRPIELSIAGETLILHGGRGVIGPYDIFVKHGFVLGMPGTDECASIERRGVCPDTAAHTSAELLDREQINMTKWSR